MIVGRNWAWNCGVLFFHLKSVKLLPYPLLWSCLYTNPWVLLPELYLLVSPPLAVVCPKPVVESGSAPYPTASPSA
ncbi:uncharacterized protein MONOS_13282 [Monocercomonoides exilis]|uniref:uncharacterized protein n=1 Tax=Monocercomonoides exilis TaxID=2049356 RepID=UPI00355A223C|nr:hypothetical protein MONOS_13282 [Monocercomonoides exilis]|eukprot:MONOS_13282.1-p1 / transcript=MONOS_13282.1 / gene=MONOS_13282 / organism=Monocercomonoides_exilis_PA203 / gene_product=unspecified product / transcript_product=unspecified product / location=Mono_scaffold00803:23331-23558(-) / protein_length=76 / sequence_SO=supercontig / SO=protein_coding / is_pseudo=false